MERNRKVPLFEMQTKSQKYDASQKSKFKSSPHIFNKMIFHWPLCSGCGMVLLKNERSIKKSKKPCESMED